MTKKDKYQWANYIRTLEKGTLFALIEGLEGNIKLGINVVANSAYLKFAKKVLRGM